MLRLLTLMSVLRAPAGEGGDGGGGGGSDPAGSQPNGGNGNGEATFVTKEQAEAIVNKAIGSRFREFEGKQAKTLDGFKTSITEGLGSLLDEKLSSFKESSEASSKGSKPADPADIANSPLFKKLQKDNETLNKRVTESEEREKQAVAKVRAEKLQRSTEETLLKHGVDPARVAAAARFLIKADEKVGHDEDGETLVFRGADGAEDFESGLKSWVASDEGKAWLPPRNVKGSGDGLGKSGKKPEGGNGNANPDAPQHTKAEIGQALFKAIATGASQA